MKADSQIEWLDQLEHSSVPVSTVNEQGKLLSYASCCLIDYAGKRLMLSVAHAFSLEKQKPTTPRKYDWVIDLKFVPGTGTLTYRPNSMEFLCRLDIHDLKIDDVDFCFTQIPSDVSAYSQRLDPNTGKVLSEIPKTIHRPSFEEIPYKGEIYGFAGQTQLAPEKPPMVDPLFESWFSITTVVDDLSYVRDEGHYNVFKLGCNYPSHKTFKGCSGAPIINRKGDVVALVCKGDITQNLIYGISLKTYRAAIDLEVGKLPIPEKCLPIPDR